MPIEVVSVNELEFGEPYGKNSLYEINLKYNEHQWSVKAKMPEIYAFSDALRGPNSSNPRKTPPLLFSDNYKENPDVLKNYFQQVLTEEPFRNMVESEIFFQIHSHIPRQHPIKVIAPLPDIDFDPTEMAVPWKLMQAAGIQVVFATETGKVPAADILLTRDEGVLFGKLGADGPAKQDYFEMEKSEAFQHPITWASIVPSDYTGMLLAGGHAPGMRQYLDGVVLQQKVSEFWALNRPVGAICHGVLLLSRCKKQGTNEPILHGKKTTTLPKYMENLAYYLTFWKLGKYYRTYDMHCETEVTTHLTNASFFDCGPTNMGTRGTLWDDTAAHVVVDGKYISGRWPGDAYLFGKKLIELLTTEASAPAASVESQ